MFIFKAAFIMLMAVALAPLWGLVCVVDALGNVAEELREERYALYRRRRAAMVRR